MKGCLSFIVHFVFWAIITIFIPTALRINTTNEAQETLTIIFWGGIAFSYMILPRLVKFIKDRNENSRERKRRKKEERRRKKEEKLRKKRLNQQKIDKEIRENQQFEMEMEQKRRMMEMEREINLKYSILERMQQMELSNMQMRRRVEEAERNFNNLSSAELSSLYRELENSNR